MTVVLGKAAYKDSVMGGHDGMERALAWQSNASLLYGLNAVYATAGITTATTTTKAKTVNAVNYAVGGNIFNLAATDNFWTLGVAGSNTTVAANSFQKYYLLVTDAGVAAVQEATQSTQSLAAVSFGNIIAQAKVNPINPYAALMSMLNGSQAMFGYITVATGASTFVPGTTALSTGGGTTVTFFNGLDPLLQPLIANDRGQILGLTI